MASTVIRARYSTSLRPFSIVFSGGFMSTPLIEKSPFAWRSFVRMCRKKFDQRSVCSTKQRMIGRVDALKISVRSRVVIRPIDVKRLVVVPAVSRIVGVELFRMKEMSRPDTAKRAQRTAHIVVITSR